MLYTEETDHISVQWKWKKREISAFYFSYQAMSILFTSLELRTTKECHVYHQYITSQGEERKRSTIQEPNYAELMVHLYILSAKGTDTDD